MPTLSELMSCTIGGVSFRLDKFQPKNDPIIKDGSGATGRTVSATGEGVIEAASGADFAAALLAFQASATSGQDFVVKENGVETYRINASETLEGGPHFAWAWGESDAPLSRRISFSVSGKQGGLDNTFTTNGYKTEITTSPAGLRTVSRTGQYAGVNAGVHFYNTVLPQFVGSFGPPNFVVTPKYATNNFNTQLDFTLTAQELVEPYPASGNAVDGTGQKSSSRDEQGLWTDVYSWDLVVANFGWQAVLDQIRQLAGDATVISRESFEVSTYKEMRIRAQFEVLRSDDPNGQIFYEQEYQFEDPGLLVSERRYPNLNPLIVQDPPGVPRLTQTGRAVGLNKWISPPDPIFPTTFAEPARISYRRLDYWRFETNWTYTMISNSITASVVTQLINGLATTNGPA